MEYIYPIDNFVVDSNNLLEEYEQVIQDNMQGHYNSHVKIIVQKVFRLYWRNTWAVDINTFATKMPYTKKIVDQVSKLYEFDTITYRLLAPCTNYRWHVDSEEKCYHIPLKVNEGCLFVYDNINYKMPINRLYIVNNSVPHTFVNASDYDRIHLMFEKKIKDS